MLILAYLELTMVNFNQEKNVLVQETEVSWFRKLKYLDGLGDCSCLHQLIPTVKLRTRLNVEAQHAVKGCIKSGNTHLMPS